MIVLAQPQIITHADGRTTSSLPITLGGLTRRVSFTVSSGPISHGVEPFLVLALLPAMRTGENIHVAGNVSPQLLQTLPQVMALLSTWFPEFRPIQITAERSEKILVPPQPSVGSFFSGGVDSFYTALKNHAEIDVLIFVHGFDLSLRQASLRSKIDEKMKTAAGKLGQKYLAVETNLRSFLDPNADWGMHAHGAGLASVALLLSPQIGRMYIPACDAGTDLLPWGTHPNLDPLWSTEGVQIVHDGCEANRIQKVAQIAESDIAMEFLRVCYENRGGDYNCGRCEKCLRTMVTLRAVGAEGKCRTFSRPLDVRAVARMALLEGHRAYHADNLAALRSRGDDPMLEQALQDSLNDKYYRGAWKTLRQTWWRVKKKWRRP